MTKFSFLAGLGLLAVSGAVLAQPAEGPRRQGAVDVTRQQVVERTAQRFARLDLNNDGRVTAEEAQQARLQRREQRAGRIFDRLDLDNDGSVSRTEFDQARGQARERRAERQEHRGGRLMHRRARTHAMRAGRLFGEQGFITREQFQERALARFDRLDADRDGTVTVAERREAFQQRRQLRGERRNRAN